MKRWGIFFLLAILALKCGTVQCAKPDTQQILGAVHEVFGALSQQSENNTNAVLEKHIDPRSYRRTFGNRGMNRNDILIEGTEIYRSGAGLRQGCFVLTLDDYDISIQGNTAAVVGYVSGTASCSGAADKKGPWRLVSCWYKNENRWYIEHLELSKLGIPKLEYYPQLPADYGKLPDHKWPLIIFLHGVGERGGTLDDLRHMNHSIPRKASTTPDFPFVAVSPLCPAGYSWSQLPYSFEELLDEVMIKYRVDPDRVYLTGLSMGGIGTWSLAARFSERFAAIAPVCGNADPAKMDRLKKVPVWAFHGARDPVVPIDGEKPAVEALKKCGGEVRYTIYPEVAHDAWVKAYDTPELYEWFLCHKRRTAQ